MSILLYLGDKGSPSDPDERAFDADQLRSWIKENISAIHLLT